jgi:uncharacterized protein YlxW (UPF0749 family)
LPCCPLHCCSQTAELEWDLAEASSERKRLQQAQQELESSAYNLAAKLEDAQKEAAAAKQAAAASQTRIAELEQAWRAASEDAVNNTAEVRGRLVQSLPESCSFWLLCLHRACSAMHFFTLMGLGHIYSLLTMHLAVVAASTLQDAKQLEAAMAQQRKLQASLTAAQEESATLAAQLKQARATAFQSGGLEAQLARASEQRDQLQLRASSLDAEVRPSLPVPSQALALPVVFAYPPLAAWSAFEFATHTLDPAWLADIYCRFKQSCRPGLFPLLPLAVVLA